MVKQCLNILDELVIDATEPSSKLNTFPIEKFVLSKFEITVLYTEGHELHND